MATTKTAAKKPQAPKPPKPPTADGVYFSRTKNDEADMARVYLKNPRQWSKGFEQSRDAKALLDGVQFGKLPPRSIEKNPVLTWRAV